MSYKYLYIHCDPDVIGFNKRQLQPSNGQAVEFEIKREAGQIFFRTALKTSLIFVGENYDFLKSIDEVGYRCAHNCLIIQKFCAGAWVDFWSGKFSFSFCKVNEDDCRIEFTPDINDEYTCLLEAATEYNILNIPHIITVRTNSGNQYEFAPCSQKKNGPCLYSPPIICGTNGGSPGSNPDYGKIMCNPVTNTPPGPPFIIHDENVSFACLPGGTYDGWQLYRNTTFITFPLLVAPTTESIWFREVRITLDVGGVAVKPVGTTWINQGALTLPNGLQAHRWTRLPFDGANYDASHYSFTHGASCENVWYYNSDVITGLTYTRGRSLTDILKYLVEQTKCFSGVTVVSDLLRINSSLTPADPDYVTGEQSQVDNLIFFEKSDVADPGSSEPATKLLLSWPALMKMLYKLFAGNPQYKGGVYWKIYPGNIIRIEHLKWFIENNGLDTTLPIYNDFTKRTKKYSFLKDELPHVEHFEFMEQSGIDFIGTDITYDTLCVNRDPVAGRSEIHLDNVTTDIGFIQTDPSKFIDNNPGFVIMATRKNNETFTLINGIGALSGLTILNAPLAWANIHDAYGRWGRIQSKGKMNGVDTNFDSWIRTKRQDPFSIPICCEDNINYNDLIKSQLGYGELESAIFTTQTEKLKITLLHY